MSNFYKYFYEHMSIFSNILKLFEQQKQINMVILVINLREI